MVEGSKKSIAHTAIYLYKRKDPLGYLRLHTATEELVVEGCLYAASDPSFSTTVGPKKIALFPLQTSPNFVSDRERDRTFAVITETGERLRVVGRVIRSQEHQAQEVPLAEHTPVPASTVAVVPSAESTNEQTPHLESRTSKSQSKESDYQIILERVKKAATLGGDTRVRMSFVHKYVGLSDKTIYRKIKQGTFPASIKQDGGAFWWVSTLDAYLKGQWPPTKQQP
jgi:predicted DNA-binding transcriptional regulator AlpA